MRCPEPDPGPDPDPSPDPGPDSNPDSNPQAQPGGQLRYHADPALADSLLGWEALPAPQTPLLFHGIAGKDEREARWPSVAGYHPSPKAVLTTCPLTWLPTEQVALVVQRGRGSDSARLRRAAAAVPPLARHARTDRRDHTLRQAGCNPTRPTCNPVSPACNPMPPACNPVHPGLQPTHPARDHMHMHMCMHMHMHM